MLLEGKVAIITGASRGIGKAIAKEFVGQGATVAFTYRSSEEKARALEAELTSNGGTVCGFKSDAAEMDQAEALVSEVIEAFGTCLLYTSPSPRDATLSRMPSSA